MEDNAADGSCSRSKPGTLSFETEPSYGLINAIGRRPPIRS
jgi:hypothetical protein